MPMACPPHAAILAAFGFECLLSNPPKQENKMKPDLLPLSDFPLRMKRIHIGTRQVPEIDGSQGAFIAIVVTLSVLIVVCCIAVFYLLWHHEPTDQERAMRRERSQYRRTRGQTQVSTDTEMSGPTLGGLGTLGGKVKRLWRSKSGGRTSGGAFGRGRAGRGWIRAGSDDEWAARSDPERGDAPSPLPKPDASVGAENGHRVHVVESPQSDVGSEFNIRAPYDLDAYAYGDPFSKNHVALQRSQSPLSSPMSSPREQASMDEAHEEDSPGGDNRHRSTMSNASVWTHAGSKFVEDI